MTQKQISSKDFFILTVMIFSLVLFGSCICCYNLILSKHEDVENALANLKSSYKRRADLIPNIANYIAIYAQHESNTYREISTIRTQALSAASSMNTENKKFSTYQKEQQELTLHLGQALSYAERFPDLKISENFKYLQAQLESTEDNINAARIIYNTKVKNFNTVVSLFPSRSINHFLAGLDKKEYAENLVLFTNDK